jgi:hypothetical protein
MLRAGDAIGFRGGLFFPGAGGTDFGRWLDFAQTFASLPVAGRPTTGAGRAMTAAGRPTTGAAR